MTMIVTPLPESVPPRVRIEVRSDDPAKLFSALQILRDGSPVRSQPQIGGTSAVVFDYEAPFDTFVEYTAEGAVVTSTAVHTETWDSLAGWTTVSGSPSVSTGRLGGGFVERPLTFPESGRLTCQGLTSPGAGAGAGGLGTSLQFKQLWVDANIGGSDGVIFFGDGLDGSQATFRTGLERPFEIIWNSNSATLIMATGTRTIPKGNPSSGAPTGLRAGVRDGATPGYVGDFTIYSVVSTPFAASASALLEVDEAWLIHPTYPSLSRSIDAGQHKFRDDGINVDASSKTTTSRAARSTRHDLEGRRRAVVITSGPRSAPEWELRLRTRRLADRDDVVQLIDDQSPLLLRSPPSWLWDLPDDWYSVGDYTEERPRASRLDAPDRVMTLPLVPVDPPIVRVGLVSTYGGDLLRYPTYRASKAAHPTYLDRLVGD